MLVNGTYNETHGIEECPRRAGAPGRDVQSLEQQQEKFERGVTRTSVPSGFFRLDSQSIVIHMTCECSKNTPITCWHIGKAFKSCLNTAKFKFNPEDRFARTAADTDKVLSSFLPLRQSGNPYSKVAAECGIPQSAQCPTDGHKAPGQDKSPAEEISCTRYPPRFPFPLSAPS
jgi:hypothetical protein